MDWRFLLQEPVPWQIEWNECKQDWLTSRMETKKKNVEHLPLSQEQKYQETYHHLMPCPKVQDVEF